jgi:hypothetical protein
MEEEKKMNKKDKSFLEAKRLWILACNYDGINPKEKFVTLSKNNPYDKPYNKAMDKYFYYCKLDNSVPL